MIPLAQGCFPLGLIPRELNGMGITQPQQIYQLAAQVFGSKALPPYTE